MGEKDLLELARVPRGTWSAWIRNGHFEDSDSGLYDEAAVVEAVVFNALTGVMPLRKASIVWRGCSSEMTRTCIQFPLDGNDPLVFVIDAHALEGAAAGAPGDLFDLVHSPVPSPRGWIAIPIADLVREARRGFWKHAKPASRLSRDGRRKVAKRKRSQRPSSSEGA